MNIFACICLTIWTIAAIWFIHETINQFTGWTIRKPLGKLLFWLGDRVSTVMCKRDIEWLYPVYYRLMYWSDLIHPWPEVKDDNDEVEI